MAGLHDFDLLRSSGYSPQELAQMSATSGQERLLQGGELQRGFRRGLLTMPALLSDAAGQVVEPISQSASAPLFDWSKAARQQAAMIPSAVPSYEGVKDASTLGSYVAGKVGENLPNMLATLPVAAAARLGLRGAPLGEFGKNMAATSAASFPLQVGEGVQTIRDDPAAMANTTPGERLALSAGYGALTAPVEAVDEALLMGRGMGAGKAVKSVFTDGLKPGLTSAAKRLGGAVPEAALTEGVPEVIQQRGQQMLHSVVNPERDTMGDTKQLKEAFFGGWAAGGGTSAAGRGADVAWSNARGLQQKVGELLAPKQLPENMRNADDQTILQWDAQDEGRRNEAARGFAEDTVRDEGAKPEWRQAAADWLNGNGSWQDIAPLAAARDKAIKAKDSFDRFVEAAKSTYGEMGKEGKNVEFTNDDKIIAGALQARLSPDSTVAQDPAKVSTLYNYLKQFIVDGGDVPVHALEQEFGSVENLRATLSEMRSMMGRAGLVEPDESFDAQLKTRFTDGKSRDEAAIKLIKANVKLEHGDALSDNEALAMGRRIEDGFKNYGTMSKENQKAFDHDLEFAFGKNAERVAETFGRKHPTEVTKVDEDTTDDEGQQNPEYKTIHEVQGAERRFVSQGKEGGLWRLDHPDQTVRKEIRNRYNEAMRTERALGNEVRSLNPAEYAEAAGVNREELAASLKTTVENLAQHPARMMMVEDKTLDKDSVDLSGDDVKRLGKSTVKELSQRVDQPTAAKVGAALKLSGSEQRQALRTLGFEHAVSLVDTPQGKVVKSNLSHSNAGRFTVKMKDGTSVVLSAQDLIKEMRGRNATNVKADRPGGSADLLRNFTTGISSLMNNPEVADIVVNDVWGREHTKESIASELKASGKSAHLAKSKHIGLVGRFGGYFKLNDKTTLRQAISVQERGRAYLSPENIRAELEEYSPELLQEHVDNMEADLAAAVARMQKGKEQSGDATTVLRNRAELAIAEELLAKQENQIEGVDTSADKYKTPHDKSVSASDIEPADEVPRTHQEETGEPLHPHGEQLTKPAPKAVGKISEQRMPMRLSAGVGKEHFTPAMRALERDVAGLYDRLGGSFNGALNSVLGYIATAAKALKNGDKAAMHAAMDNAKGRYTVIKETMMERGRQVKAQPAVAQQNAEAKVGATVTEEDMQSVKDYVAKVLGPKVVTEFVKVLRNPKTGKFEGGSAQWTRKNGEAFIRIVVGAANPMSKAHHEAMHEFFQRLMETEPATADILRKAAGSATVTRQIEQFFHDEPNRAEILKQINDSDHERVAYMFQLWVSGNLNLGPNTETVFQRVVNFLRKTFNMLSEDQRAEAIMQAFHNGEMSEPNHVAQVLSKNVDQAKVDKYAAEAKRLTDTFMHWFGTTSGHLIGNENPHLDAIGRSFYNAVGSTDKQGYLQARDQKANQMVNRVAMIFEGVDAKDVALALKVLQTKGSSNDAVVQGLVNRTRNMLDQIYDYLEASNTGVKKRKDYFPRVWDVVYLSEHRQEFIDKLVKHHGDVLKELGGDQKVSPAAVAEGIAHTLLENRGADPSTENEWRVGYTPFMQAANARLLGWIDDAVFNEFYNKDMVHILTTYAAQAAHKGEYAKRFGSDGAVLRDQLNDALLWQATEGDKAAIEKARKEVVKASGGKFTLKTSNTEMLDDLMSVLASNAGVDPKDFRASTEAALHYAKRDIMAQEGTLGHDIDERLRSFSSGMIVYQNMRLLGLSLFSQFIDPLGTVVNGGSLQGAFETFKRGIVGTIHGWKGTQPSDEMSKLGRAIGIIDSHSVLNSMGSMYSSLYMGKTAKKWNDRLFRINGVEMFTQQVRIGAMESGIEMITRNLVSPTKDSARKLKELGLDPDDKLIIKDGKLDFTNQDVQAALMRFVDSSIARPNAAIRPAYGSDPRFAILFHMKSFTYAFHKVILEKIAHEASNGNYNPAFTAVLAYVPLMITADVLRGLLANGGEEPDWKKRWKLKDYVADGVQRAGLLGIPQLGLDAVKWGPTEFAGPAVGQLSRAASRMNNQFEQHRKLAETDPERYEKDSPVYDAGRKILREALPINSVTKNFVIDKHQVDSSNGG